ncbi:MAG: VOC family protein [Pseudomonadota bacterium]
MPILFVRDGGGMLSQEARLQSGFPPRQPFYGSVSRDGLCLHLRFVERPNFAELAARESSLILATIEVNDVKALFTEYDGKGIDVAQRPVKQAWGGTDFHVRDPDGNLISFVQYRTSVSARSSPQ